jgi:hypothetical protein
LKLIFKMTNNDKVKRKPKDQEIVKKGLVCDGKPLPKIKNKSSYKPSFLDKDMANMYQVNDLLNPLKDYPLHEKEEE